MAVSSLLLRLLPYGAALAALVALYMAIDHAGYQRAQAADAAARSIAEGAAARITAQIEHDLGARLDGIYTNLSGEIGGIDAVNRTIIQPVIQKEIASDPRYSDPDTGISVGMFAAINTARALSDPARAGAGVTVAVPDAVAAAGPGDWDARDRGCVGGGAIC